MKKINLMLSICFILLGIISANAQYKQQERKIPLKMPKQVFDEAAAKDALEPGSATLTGVVRLTLDNKRIVVGRNTTVDLYPMTPYFEEWYKLKKKENVRKNKLVGMDSLAAKYRVYCETNNDGDFTFPNLKPGKYILYTTVYWRTDVGVFYEEWVNRKQSTHMVVNIKPGKDNVKVVLGRPPLHFLL